MRTVSATKALLWKEWRERWGYWVGLLMACPAVMWLPEILPAGAHHFPYLIWTLVWAIGGIVAGATSLAHERATQTLGFLSAQALTRRRIWLVKALASTAFLAGILCLCLTMNHTLRPFRVQIHYGRDAAKLPVTLVPEQILAQAGGLPVLCLAIAFVCSTVLDKTIVAVGASAVLSLAALLFIEWLSFLDGRSAGLDRNLDRAAIAALVLAAGLMTASYIAFCRHEMWPDGRATRKAVMWAIVSVLVAIAVAPVSRWWDRADPANEIHEIRALATTEPGRTVFEAADESGRLRLWELPWGGDVPLPLARGTHTPVLAPGLSTTVGIHGLVPCMWRGKYAVLECDSELIHHLPGSPAECAKGLVAKHAGLSQRWICIIGFTYPVWLWENAFLALAQPAEQREQCYFGSLLTGRVRSLDVDTQALKLMRTLTGQDGRYRAFPSADGTRLVAQRTGESAIWLVDLAGTGTTKMEIEGALGLVEWPQAPKAPPCPRILVRQRGTDLMTLWLHTPASDESAGGVRALIADATSIRPNAGAYLVRETTDNEVGLWVIHKGKARMVVKGGLRDAHLQCACTEELTFIRYARELWHVRRSDRLPPEKRWRPIRVWPRDGVDSTEG